MNKSLPVAALAGFTMLVGASVASAHGRSSGFDFQPLAESAAPTTTPDAAAPWNLPARFTQELVSGELSDRCGGDGLNIYGAGLNDWNDMNTVNETGRQAGRYLYRTHEVRLGSVPDATYPEGGAVSVVDLKTCESRIIAQDPSWTAIDGIVWTPWGTALFAEETTGGRLFELIPSRRNPMEATVIERPAVGHMAHEGIEIGPNGEIYVVDENRGQSGGSGGGVYKFVPDSWGDLSAGSLYQLAVDDGDGSGLIGENVGQGSWVGPIDPDNVRADGTAQGGAAYERPEDLEVIGDRLFVAITEGTKVGSAENYDGRVLAVNVNTMMVSDYVKPGLNIPVEASGATGFDNPDNLAKGPDGKLWIIEDNVPSDIWVATGRGGQADSVALFASLTDQGAEGTGIYFSPRDPETLYVNVQHSIYADGDGTWAITKAKDDRRDNRDDHDDNDRGDNDRGDHDGGRKHD